MARMTKTFTPLLALAAIATASCGGPTPATVPANDAATNDTVVADAPAANEIAPAPATTARVENDYVGRWTGVEGTYLDVAKRDGGGVTLDMQWTLDDKGSFDGSVTPDGLRFTRNGKDEIARPSDGDATGLKWLAGKKDCLTVRSGEGYCRD